MSERKAVIKNADMSEDMQQDAVDCASQALEKYNIEKVRMPLILPASYLVEAPSTAGSSTILTYIIRSFDFVRFQPFCFPTALGYCCIYQERV